MSNYDYRVDLVLAIDGTGSMRNVIEGVRRFARDMHDQIMSAMEHVSKRIDGLRVKVIVFRDFAVDAQKALETLEFRKIPEEAAEVVAFVDAIEAGGGGDNPENGLEGLALAINSNWTSEGTKQRHIIMLFTDVEPHPYLTKKGTVTLPDLPASINDLIDQWNLASQSVPPGLTKTSRRMFLFVPDVEAWNQWVEQKFVVALPVQEILNDPEGTRSEILRLIQESVA